MKHKLILLIVVLLGLFLVSGCKSGAGAGTPGTDGYPPPDVTGSGESLSTGSYPAPAGAPVRENASLLNIEILSITPSGFNPQYMVLQAHVNSTSPANGLEEYDPNLAGQEVFINLLAGDATNLAPGDIINLTVSYRGDEWGGGYYSSNIAQP